MPSVTGLTISWPDDGYYQVQTTTDYSTTCEATRQCTVSVSEYTVINHTTGQRFENVVVNNPMGNDTDLSFDVVGNSLLFPEDNWFQVQNRTSFESLCNGESSCLLEPGCYIVINHTLGQRIENVVIGQPDGPVNPGNPPLVNEPMINGNVISWAGGSWYQVQKSRNFTSVCQGGRSCEVTLGTYHVINHTTGTRYENIVVNSTTPNPPINPGVPPVGIYPSQLLTSDATEPVPVNPR